MAKKIKEDQLDSLTGRLPQIARLTSLQSCWWHLPFVYRWLKFNSLPCFLSLWLLLPFFQTI